MVGTVGETSHLGNTILVDYGIQHDESDYRIHICVEAKYAYIFPTAAGREAAESGLYYPKPVWTKGIQTATGYLVPPDNLSGCWWIPIPDALLSSSGIQCSRLTTSQKGKRAERIAQQMINSGMIAFPIQAEENTDIESQMRGLDGTVTNQITYQVKCDYRGGHREFGGTGNLFLQIAECNPWNQH